MPSWRTRLHPNEVVLMAAYVAGLRGKNLKGRRAGRREDPALAEQCRSRRTQQRKRNRVAHPSEQAVSSRSAGARGPRSFHDDGRRLAALAPSAACLGPYLRARRILAYVLIAIFTLLPYLKIHGKPAVLLDLPDREFTIFGFTFLSTDTLLLALALITLVLGICLVTALAGRMWCGWMCPQTVYMEFVFRPIERLFDGPPGARHRPGRKRTTPRTRGQICPVPGDFRLSGPHLPGLLRRRRGPGPVGPPFALEHPVPFLVMLAVTGLMMFDFVYFREQTCIVACPYGRFQSVMLDRDSLIVSYDPRRGEPRGKLGDRKGGGSHGDCIDCGMCTDTCPTGIDIRDGLQLECIACTQCIDACNGVMERIGKPKGLIRLSSQAAIEGHPRPLAATAGDPLSGPDARAGGDLPGGSLQ